MSSINLYLIRHGIAAERGTYANDGDRPLTEEGRQKTRKVAKRLQELGLTFDLILSSPLVRAQQTAEILRTVGLSQQLEVSSALAPEGDIYTWLTWFEQWRQTGETSLALVGHEPDLGQWAEVLVWGAAKDHLVVKKAGIIGLTLSKTGSPIGNSCMFWLTPPKFLM